MYCNIRWCLLEFRLHVLVYDAYVLYPDISWITTPIFQAIRMEPFSLCDLLIFRTKYTLKSSRRAQRGWTFYQHLPLRVPIKLKGCGIVAPYYPFSTQTGRSRYAFWFSGAESLSMRVHYPQSYRVVIRISIRPMGWNMSCHQPQVDLDLEIHLPPKIRWCRC